MEKLITRTKVSNYLLETAKDAASVHSEIIENSIHELGKRIGDILSDGEEYIMTMHPPEISRNDDTMTTSYRRVVDYSQIVHCKDCAKRNYRLFNCQYKPDDWFCADGELRKWVDMTDYLPSAYGKEADDTPLWNFKCPECSYRTFEAPANIGRCPKCGVKLKREKVTW